MPKRIPIVLSCLVLFLSASMTQLWAEPKGELAQLKAFLKGNPGLLNQNDEETGATLLHLAVCREDRDSSIAAYLITKGANVNAKNSEGRTPLHVALSDDQYDCAKLLIKNGADPNAKDNNGTTALFLAEEVYLYDVAKLLVDKGADVNAVDGRGQSVLRHAATGNEKDICQLLVAKGARPDIFAASLLGDAKTVDDLLRADPLLAKAVDSGVTPLHLAVTCGSRAVVDTLVKAGADPCAQWKFSCFHGTPLHIAARSGNKAVTELLIPAASDVNVRDQNGSSPMDEALSCKHADIAKLLEAHGGRCYHPHTKPKSGKK